MPADAPDLFSREILGNDVATWLLAAGIALATLAVLLILRGVARQVLRRLARRPDSTVDEELEGIVHQTSWVFLVALAVLVGSRALVLPERTDGLIATASVLVVLYQLGLWTAALVVWSVDRVGQKNLGEPLVVDPSEAARAPAVLRLIAKVVVWAIVLVVALQNLGVDVTALVAGLGVGGIAVALAVQNILGDLIASLSIVLDKPFEVGHFIVVGNDAGTVERVGLKTTRVRALSGQQIIFSNSDLLQSRVNNYRRMVERRAVQRFRLVYDTDPELLERALAIVQEVVTGAERVRLDRVHLDTFGPDGYEYELVFWVLEPDYLTFMDVKQGILLEVVRRFAAEGIRIAVPVRRMLAAGELDALGPRPARAV